MSKTTVFLLFSFVALRGWNTLTLVSAAPLATEIILRASDGAYDDRMGQALAIDGNYAIVGANLNDDDGLNSGSAYVFDATTGQELFKLTASDAMRGDLFGHSLAISGNTALVGAFAADRVGIQSGAAYLFDVATGSELFKLVPSDLAEGDYLGHGVGISGDRAIVGSHGADAKGINSGAAYIFDVTTGQELFKLTASDGTGGDQFGYWTAISGNIAIVGAKHDDDSGSSSGSAYLYDVTTGQELMKLTASDASANAEFGYAVAIDGNTAVVGAYGDNNHQGAVYVFDVTTGSELRKITASDGQVGDWFGYSLGISGTRVFVGAYNDDDHGTSSGSAYLYDLELGNELFERKITASDAMANDEFGTAVGITGNTAIVGAWLKNTVSGLNGVDVGQAYLYDVLSTIPLGPDFNKDGSINEADLALWQSSYSGPLYDVNYDGLVNDEDYQIWQQSYHTDIPFDDSLANLNQQGPVDGEDLLILQQAYGVDADGDIDGDGDTDGADFLLYQRMFTPFEAADANRDRVVDEKDLELWNLSNGYTGLYDANGDGVSDGRDFLIWQRRFTQSANLTAVPEPSSLFLCILSMFACKNARGQINRFGSVRFY